MAIVKTVTCHSHSYSHLSHFWLLIPSATLSVNPRCVWVAGGGRGGRFNCFRMGFVYVYQLSGEAAAVINAPDNYYMRFT